MPANPCIALCRIRLIPLPSKTSSCELLPPQTASACSREAVDGDWTLQMGDVRIGSIHVASGGVSFEDTEGGKAEYEIRITLKVQYTG